LPIQEAATGLLADLDFARDRTNGWQDAELGYALIDVALTRCLSRLSATGLVGRDNERPSSEFWRIAGSLLEVGSLQQRARFKPRGYAGDYLMLARLCERYKCEDPLGRLFDRYFQSQAAVRAVRSRTQLIAASLAEFALSTNYAPLRVCSIGSGPAIDLERAMRLLPEARRREMEITLLDLDEEALSFAASRLQNVLEPRQIVCRRDNLFRLADKPNAAIVPESCHFMVCSGFFDYLAIEPAVKLLSWMWQRLSSGGRLLVGNFAPHNPSRAYMEWIGNWYLIYRTQEEMIALASAAEISPANCHVTAERLGIDLFLCATR